MKMKLNFLSVVFLLMVVPVRLQPFIQITQLQSLSVPSSLTTTQKNKPSINPNMPGSTQMLFNSLWSSHEGEILRSIVAKAIDMMSLKSGDSVIVVGPSTAVWEPIGVAMHTEKVTVIQPPRYIDYSRESQNQKLKTFLERFVSRIQQLTGTQNFLSHISFVDRQMQDAQIEANSIRAIIMMNINGLFTDLDRLFNSVIHALAPDGFVLHGDIVEQGGRTEVEIFEDYCKKHGYTITVHAFNEVQCFGRAAYALFQIHKTVPDVKNDYPLEQAM